MRVPTTFGPDCHGFFQVVHSREPHRNRHALRRTTIMSIMGGGRRDHRLASLTSIKQYEITEQQLSRWPKGGILYSGLHKQKGAERLRNDRNNERARIFPGPRQVRACSQAFAEKREPRAGGVLTAHERPAVAVAASRAPNTAEGKREESATMPVHQPPSPGWYYSSID